MKINNIIKEEGDIYIINIDEVKSFKCDYEFIVSHDLYKEKEIDDYLFWELDNFYENEKAKKRAFQILSFRDHSKKELIDKLISKGFTEDQSYYAVECCEKLGYINEDEYLKTLIKKYYSKGFGKKRVAFEVRHKGLGDNYLLDDFLNDFEPSCDEKIEEILKNRFSDLKSEKDKEKLEKLKNRAMNYLMRYGYEFSDILRIIQNFIK